MRKKRSIVTRRPTPWLRLYQAEGAAFKQLLVRRNHVNMVWLHLDGPAHLHNGIGVFSCRMPARLLSKSGARCMTTTKANPLSAAIPAKNCWSAAMPPADAPSPTTAAGSFGSRRFWLRRNARPRSLRQSRSDQAP